MSTLGMCFAKKGCKTDDIKGKIQFFKLATFFFFFYICIKHSIELSYNLIFCQFVFTDKEPTSPFLLYLEDSL